MTGEVGDGGASDNPDSSSSLSTSSSSLAGSSSWSGSSMTGEVGDGVTSDNSVVPRQIVRADGISRRNSWDGWCHTLHRTLNGHMKVEPMDKSLQGRPGSSLDYGGSCFCHPANVLELLLPANGQFVVEIGDFPPARRTAVGQLYR